MSVEPTPQPLSLVAPQQPNRHAERVLRQWDPEAQLIGALMHLPVTKADDILTLVPDGAVWHPDNRWAYQLIRYLVDSGADPGPVAVLHAAGERPPDDDACLGKRVSGERLHRFAVHLAELYTATVAPSAARQYARDVLDDAYRRAVRAHAAHMAELADGGAPRDELTAELTAMRAELADLWRRAEAASHSRPVPNH